ncbi:MAG: formimidoylglutamate deiminase [Actinomycetes bacterium]
MTRYWCASAWLPEARVAPSVLIDTDGSPGQAVITGVTPGVPRPPDAVRLDGLVLPGFADVHSHAFHRVLRGRTHAGGGTFWTWREAMYAVAARLDPDSYRLLARAVFAEMVVSGITGVGEFHYLHHGRDGHPYPDPNAMGRSLVEAAVDTGIRLTLVDTCYLRGGLAADGTAVPLADVQHRFSDGDAQRWSQRVDQLAAQVSGQASVRVGAAIHSVRAVPPEQLATVAAWARERQVPLHVHLSEQPTENTATRAAYGVSPTALLARAGVLAPSTTVVHATHLDELDVATLGAAGVSVAMCPTTERDLADGIGPAGRLVRAGARLVLGSDSHAVIDLLEEARGVELDERLATGSRGSFAPGPLVTALTADGHRALGWPDAGRLAPGAPADLVAIRMDSVRTAGADPSQVVFAATAADVHTVVVGGRELARDGRHRVLGEVGPLLAQAVHELAGPADQPGAP